MAHYCTGEWPLFAPGLTDQTARYVEDQGKDVLCRKIAAAGERLSFLISADRAEYEPDKRSGFTSADST